MAEVIVVSGSPGTGKSVLSSALAQLIGCRVLESSQLFRSFGVLRRDPSGRDSEIVDEGGAGEAIRSVTIVDNECIVVDTLHPILWVENAYENVVAVILLRCNPMILEERLAARGWSRAKVIENVLAEAFNIIAEELIDYEDLVLEVDTTHGSVDSVLGTLLDKLESWDTGIRVDWLSLDSRLVELVTKLVHELDLYKERLGV